MVNREEYLIKNPFNLGFLRSLANGVALLLSFTLVGFGASKLEKYTNKPEVYDGGIRIEENYDYENPNNSTQVNNSYNQFIINSIYQPSKEREDVYGIRI